MRGVLYIVPTPIGNLGDITERALDVLASADVVCAEDTRVTGKLLAHFDIHTHLERCDENVIAQRTPALLERLLNGEHIAFCSDAGMPGISDPGITLVAACLEHDIPVIVLPGASAVTTALVASGFTYNAFYFGGFLPRKDSERIKTLDSLAQLDAALVFYESPHRVASSVACIAQAYGNRKIALCRELTKLHEEVLRLPAQDLAIDLSKRESIKGEIVLVVAPPEFNVHSSISLDDPDLHERIKTELASGASKSSLAKDLAHELNIPKNKLYELIHKLA